MSLFEQKGLGVWKMFTKFATFKMHEHKHNCKQV